MQHFGDVLTDIVMPDLETSETESSVEINFIIGKIKHTVKRVRNCDTKNHLLAEIRWFFVTHPAAPPAELLLPWTGRA